jgi:hypothetical protein
MRIPRTELGPDLVGLSHSSLTSALPLLSPPLACDLVLESIMTSTSIFMLWFCSLLVAMIGSHNGVMAGTLFLMDCVCMFNVCSSIAVSSELCSHHHETS